MPANGSDNASPANKPEEDISEEEARLYDRQIRLWGVDVQKAIGNSAMLVVGLTGLASEVVKNVVLAGIKAVTLVDDQVVMPADACANLFAHHPNGAQRTQLAERLVKQLNPHVKVTTRQCSAAELLVGETKDVKQFFGQFSVVVVFNQGLEVTSELNKVCHEHSVPFISAANWGYHSFVFLDAQPEKGSVTLATALERKTFQLDRKVPAANITRRRELNKLEDIKSFVGMVLTLYKYFDRRGHFPRPGVDFAGDKEELAQFESEMLTELNMQGQDWRQFDEGRWYSEVCGELSFATSIAGGFLSQDILGLVAGEQLRPFNALIYHTVQQQHFCMGY